MTLNRRFDRLRKAARDPTDPENHWALWIETMFAEPFGMRRWGIQAHFTTGPDVFLGRGRTLRSALRDAEKKLGIRKRRELYRALELLSSGGAILLTERIKPK